MVKPSTPRRSYHDLIQPTRETARARAAYELYRDMGDGRSLEAAASILGKSRQLLNIWSVRHHWQERIQAFDREIAEKAERFAIAERVKDIEKRRKQREQVAAVVRGKGVEALAEMRPRDLARRPYAVVQMLAYADATERLDMGEATNRAEVTGKDGTPLTFTLTIDDKLRLDDGGPL